MSSKKINYKYPGLIEFIIEYYVKKGIMPSELYEEVVKRFDYERSARTFGTYCCQIRKGNAGGSITGQKNTRYTRQAEDEAVPLDKGQQLHKPPPIKRPVNQTFDEMVESHEKNEAPPTEEIQLEEEFAGEETRDEILFIELLQKQKSISLIELCNTLDCAPFRIKQLIDFYRSKGLEVHESDGMVFLSTHIIPNVEKVETISEDKEIAFGVASDLHFGSKSVQITALHEFCNLCEKQGVKHIFSPGDAFSGTKVYPGHEYGVYALSAEEQEASLIVNLPTGFEWYILGGNHDYSFIKRGGGHNPILAVANQRPDIHYVGFDEADVPILPGVDLKMWHPSGGVPYSISYRLQKGIEQIAYTELNSIVREVKKQPTVRFVMAGHLHIQMQALFGSIFGAQCGCFEGQTDYLKRKGLFPHIGGYIIKASLGKNGLLKNFEAKFYIFDEIQDDYKNFNHEYKMPEVLTPVFVSNGNGK